ncbi:glycosyltransferase [Paenibacillus sp. WC2504]|uniref:glycosyltransferase n=1 Tax=Paenibacillus sp. WC2504 TaxID=3461403 RepID=UPI0040467CE2
MNENFTGPSNSKISVVIPIYNVEKWLENCLHSVLKQTYDNFEIIIVNDGSTDRSAEIAEKFVKKDFRINLISKKNGGVSSARNTGMSVATGKYITFIDPDDELSENFFVKMFNVAEIRKCDVVIAGYQTTPTNTKFAPRFKTETTMTGKELILSASKVHTNNDLCFAWRNLYNLETLKRNKVLFNENVHIGEDTIFNLEAILKSDRVCAIQDIMYFYTVNNQNSAMRVPYNPKLESSLILQYKIRNKLSNDFGLLNNNEYRKDLANYYIKNIYRMLITNIKNSPECSKEDIDRIANLEMMTESAKEIGFFYNCNNLKEYAYYLALKFKLVSFIFKREFSFN